MPELPEVETIKRQLNKTLPQKVVSTSKSEYIASLLKTKPLSLKNKILNQVHRHGKFLIFDFDDLKVISHLGMSGTWRISKEKLKEKHIHYSLKTKEYYYQYQDPRRFGKLLFFSNKDFQKFMSTKSPDIRSRSFTQKHLLTIINKNSTSTLKPLLLDQSYFSGVGNYMASEICALAKIRPDRKIGSLNEEEVNLLFFSLKNITKQAIYSGGVTFQGGYKDTSGSKGKGVTNLLVFYQKICGLCKNESVIKIQLGGRGTYFCPNCQK